jgi:hypothetical protein
MTTVTLHPYDGDGQPMTVTDDGEPPTRTDFGAALVTIGQGTYRYGDPEFGGEALHVPVKYWRLERAGQPDVYYTATGRHLPHPPACIAAGT